MRLAAAWGFALGICVLLARPARADLESDTLIGIAPLDRAMGLALKPGEEIVIRGAMRTSFDGTVFDAATRTDMLPSGASVRADGLFEAASGGLAVVASDPKTHAVRYVATGAEGASCRRLGLPSPCLVPRVNELAHERLLTESEFKDTLTGSLEVVALTPTPVAIAPRTRHALAVAAFGLAAAIFAGLAAHFARARRKTAIGQVRVLARAAKSATQRDGTLGAVRAQIDDLVVRAEKLDEARRACAARLKKIDRAALERKRAHWASSTAPEAAEVLAWASAECAEAARLEGDLSSSVHGLEKIASTLRVIALHARSHRDVRTRLGSDPTDAVASELRMRDEAFEETERASLGR